MSSLCWHSRHTTRYKIWLYTGYWFLFYFPGELRRARKWTIPFRCLTLNVWMLIPTNFMSRVSNHVQHTICWHTQMADHHSLIIAQVSVCPRHIFVDDPCGFPQLHLIKRDSLKQYLVTGSTHRQIRWLWSGRVPLSWTPCGYTHLVWFFN